MELCTARLATSQKLRQEWDKRLENNSLAVDRIQENRDLWLHAGGCDPEVLNTPTEIHLEAVARTLSTLNAMLEKYGPRGGLDSFVEEIQNAAKLLKVVSPRLRSSAQVCSCIPAMLFTRGTTHKLHLLLMPRLGGHQTRSLQSHTETTL